MQLGIKVGDMMTRNFVSVNPETPIIECARTMIKKRVGSLVLKENNKLSGILTEGDIIYALSKKPKELEKIKAKDVARKKVQTIKPSEDIAEALKKMKKTRFRWLPVAIKNDVVGFVTLKDILKIEPNLFDAFSEIMQIKEEQAKLKKIKNYFPRKKGNPKEGMCEECGSPGLLFRYNDKLICENCYEQI
jgi:CBS domain-containing protein